MRKFLFIFSIFAQFLWAANLLSYNIYDRPNRVDLLLTFDEPYNGKITKRDFEGYKIVKLYNISYPSEIKKKLDSKILKEIDIIPRKSDLYIFLKSDKDISVKVEKTTDGFGIRIRSLLLKENKSQEKASSLITKEDENTLPLKKNLVEISLSYYLVMLFLILIAILLYLFKDKLQNRDSSGGWLFKTYQKPDEDRVVIRFQKQIDPKNRVLLIDYRNTSYLILAGSTNILLDKFTKGNVKKEEEFEDIFEKNRKRLDEYLKLHESKLQDYKTKVSRDIEDLLE